MIGIINKLLFFHIVETKRMYKSKDGTTKIFEFGLVTINLYFRMISAYCYLYDGYHLFTISIITVFLPLEEVNFVITIYYFHGFNVHLLMYNSSPK